MFYCRDVLRTVFRFFFLSKDCNSGVHSWHSLWSHAKCLGNWLPARHNVTCRVANFRSCQKALPLCQGKKGASHRAFSEADLLLLPRQRWLPWPLGEDGPCDPHPCFLAVLLCDVFVCGEAVKKQLLQELSTKSRHPCIALHI